MKKAMIYGAGISGLGAKNLLEKEGYEIYLVDDRVGINSKEALVYLKNVDIFIKSPGVPYNQLVKEAQENNIEIIDEIELGYRYMKKNKINSKIIAITGTNGKTTTTTKITELLNYSGYKAEYAGNIGKSFSQLLLEKRDLDYVVLELSSFQLENIHSFKADISMIINLTPDHLERYSNQGEYYDTKFNICKNQENGYFIYNLDDKEIVKRKEMIKTEIYPVSLYEKGEFDINEIVDIDRLSLKGKHNLENTLFIIGVGKICNIPMEKIREFLYSTKNVVHRMEEFYNYGKIKFINDSKGTNIEATKFAVEAFKECVLICGGYNKHLQWEQLAKLIKDRVKEVYLIGEISDILEEELQKLAYPQSKIHNLKEIIKCIEDIKIRCDENKEEIILFSPGTSSYDQFKNYEKRGEFFKEEVIKIFGR